MATHRGTPLAVQAEVAARRAEVVRLKARGLPYSDIAKRLGISEEVARQDLSRARRARAAELRDSVDEFIAGEVEELERLQLVSWGIALGQHKKVHASGNVAKDEDGNPVLDYGVNLQAVNTLVRIQERKAKLLGYDAAMKIDLKAQVVTLDAIDAAIGELRRELAEEEERGV